MYDFTLKGYLNSDVATVYQAFSEPDILSKWFAPGNLMVSQMMLSFIEGGQYRTVLVGPDGFQQTIMGTYQEIVPNERLSFTWRWDDTNDITKVDVTFNTLPNSTTSIHLCQSGFAQEQDMLSQQYAWLACLEKLSLATRNFSPVHNQAYAA
jgi:uncharacterized protein YndB with AHSA1/START domain